MWNSASAMLDFRGDEYSNGLFTGSVKSSKQQVPIPSAEINYLSRHMYQNVMMSYMGIAKDPWEIGHKCLPGE